MPLFGNTLYDPITQTFWASWKLLVLCRVAVCSLAMWKSCDSFSNFQPECTHGQLTPICSCASSSLQARYAKTGAAAWQYGPAGGITGAINTSLPPPGVHPSPVPQDTALARRWHKQIEAALQWYTQIYIGTSPRLPSACPWSCTGTDFHLPHSERGQGIKKVQNWTYRKKRPGFT